MGTDQYYLKQSRIGGTAGSFHSKIIMLETVHDDRGGPTNPGNGLSENPASIGDGNHLPRSEVPSVFRLLKG